MATEPNYVVLSIDFDFFIEEKLERDWGHRENGLFIEAIWPHRASHLLASGADLLKDAGLVEDPTKLFSKLQKLKWKFKRNARTSIAESHSSAYHALKDKKNLEIINVDAHHDIGYDQTDKLDCGNWIYQLAVEGKVKKVTIVYPEWRKKINYDFPADNFIEKMKEFQIDFDIVYGIESTPPRKVEEIFIARSGAWVPPWTDSAFYEFLDTWMLRSSNITLWGYDSLIQFKRKFNLEEVKTAAEKEKKMMSELKDSLPKGSFFL